MLYFVWPIGGLAPLLERVVLAASYGIETEARNASAGFFGEGAVGARQTGSTGNHDRSFAQRGLVAEGSRSPAGQPDAAAAEPTPQGQTRFGRPVTRASDQSKGSGRLARSIQAELRRVGCYAGSIDGSWDEATQRAMAEFNRKIHATLPVARPDYILLTLLQGHSARACGQCPFGDVASADGFCQLREQTAGASGGPPPGTASAASPSALAGVASPSVPLNVIDLTTTAPPRGTGGRDGRRMMIAAEEAQRVLLAEHAHPDKAPAPSSPPARSRYAPAAGSADPVALARLATAKAHLRDAEARRAAAARALAEQGSRLAQGGDEAMASRRPGWTSTERSALGGAPSPSTADERTVAPQARATAGVALASAATTLAPRGDAIDAAARPRFVGPFVPPPTYRLGVPLPGAGPALKTSERREPRIARRAPAPAPTRLSQQRWNARGVFARSQENSP